MNLQTEAGLTCDPACVISWGSRCKQNGDWRGATASCTCHSETKTKAEG